MLSNTDGATVKSNLADLIGLYLVNLHQGIAVGTFHNCYCLLFGDKGSISIFTTGTRYSI